MAVHMMMTRGRKRRESESNGAGVRGSGPTTSRSRQRAVSPLIDALPQRKRRCSGVKNFPAATFTPKPKTPKAPAKTIKKPASKQVAVRKPGKTTTKVNAAMNNKGSKRGRPSKKITSRRIESPSPPRERVPTNSDNRSPRSPTRLPRLPPTITLSNANQRCLPPIKRRSSRQSEPDDDEVLVLDSNTGAQYRILRVQPPTDNGSNNTNTSDNNSSNNASKSNLENFNQLYENLPYRDKISRLSRPRSLSKSAPRGPSVSRSRSYDALTELASKSAAALKKYNECMLSVVSFKVAFEGVLEADKIKSIVEDATKTAVDWYTAAASMTPPPPRNFRPSMISPNNFPQQPPPPLNI